MNRISWYVFLVFLFSGTNIFSITDEQVAKETLTQEYNALQEQVALLKRSYVDQFYDYYHSFNIDWTLVQSISMVVLSTIIWIVIGELRVTMLRFRVTNAMNIDLVGLNNDLMRLNQLCGELQVSHGDMVVQLANELRTLSLSLIFEFESGLTVPQDSLIRKFKRLLVLLAKGSQLPLEDENQLYDIAISQDPHNSPNALTEIAISELQELRENANRLLELTPNLLKAFKASRSQQYPESSPSSSSFNSIASDMRAVADSMRQPILSPAQSVPTAPPFSPPSRLTHYLLVTGRIVAGLGLIYGLGEVAYKLARYYIEYQELKPLEERLFFLKESLSKFDEHVDNSSISISPALPIIQIVNVSVIPDLLTKIQAPNIAVMRNQSFDQLDSQLLKPQKIFWMIVQPSFRLMGKQVQVPKKLDVFDGRTTQKHDAALIPYQENTLFKQHTTPLDRMPLAFEEHVKNIFLKLIKELTPIQQIEQPVNETKKTENITTALVPYVKPHSEKTDYLLPAAPQLHLGVIVRIRQDSSALTRHNETAVRITIFVSFECFELLRLLASLKLAPLMLLDRASNDNRVQKLPAIPHPSYVWASHPEYPKLLIDSENDTLLPRSTFFNLTKNNTNVLEDNLPKESSYPLVLWNNQTQFISTNDTKKADEPPVKYLEQPAIPPILISRQISSDLVARYLLKEGSPLRVPSETSSLPALSVVPKVESQESAYAVALWQPELLFDFGTCNATINTPLPILPQYQTRNISLPKISILPLFKENGHLDLLQSPRNETQLLLPANEPIIEQLSQRMKEESTPHMIIPLFDFIIRIPIASQGKGDPNPLLDEKSEQIVPETSPSPADKNETNSMPDSIDALLEKLIKDPKATIPLAETPNPEKQQPRKKRKEPSTNKPAQQAPEEKQIKIEEPTEEEEQLVKNARISPAESAKPGISRPGRAARMTPTGTSPKNFPSAFHAPNFYKPSNIERPLYDPPARYPWSFNPPPPQPMATNSNGISPVPLPNNNQVQPLLRPSIKPEIVLGENQQNSAASKPIEKQLQSIVVNSDVIEPPIQEKRSYDFEPATMTCHHRRIQAPQSSREPAHDKPPQKSKKIKRWISLFALSGLFFIWKRGGLRISKQSRK